MELELPAGTYYLGDICYPLGSTPLYSAIFENSTHACHYEKAGLHVVIDSTAWGDGTYRDQMDYEYSVDSGTIGIVSLALIDMKAFEKKYKELPGRMLTFDKPFTFEADGGVFHAHGFAKGPYGYNEVVEAYIDTR
jgi:hypothetical protein